MKIKNSIFISKKEKKISDNFKNYFIKKNLNSSIPFINYMNDILYHPKFGYYLSKNIKFGNKGDFYTSSEISKFFSFCVASNIKFFLNNFSKLNILEIGPGSGIFSKNLIKYFLKSKIKINKYYLLEINNTLVKKQKKILNKSNDFKKIKIVWIKKISDLKNFKGIIIANEIIDSFPVHRFLVYKKYINEYYVEIKKNNKLSWKLDKPNKNLKKYVKKNIHLFPKDIPYISEYNPYISKWLKDISSISKKTIFYIFDYGSLNNEYYHHQKINGSLRCYFKNTVNYNPFLFLGLQDITADVNFSEIIRISKKLEWNLLFYSTQEDFILNYCNIEKIFDDYKNNYKYINRFKILTSPEYMGQKFKVSIFSKNIFS